MARTVKATYEDVQDLGSETTLPDPSGYEVHLTCDVCLKTWANDGPTVEAAEASAHSDGWHVGPAGTFCEAHKPGATGMRVY